MTKQGKVRYRFNENDGSLEEKLRQIFETLTREREPLCQMKK